MNLRRTPNIGLVLAMLAKLTGDPIFAGLVRMLITHPKGTRNTLLEFYWGLGLGVPLVSEVDGVGMGTGRQQN